MSDIIERLMRFAGKVCLSTDTEIEAAAEIERLRTENAKFREAELIFSKDGQKWRTAISIFKEQDAKIDKLENIIEDDAKLILRVRMENEKLRAALEGYREDARNFLVRLDDLNALRAENEKLRAELEATKSPPDYGTQKIMNEQIHYASLIAQKDRENERLRAENEKLRAALKEAASWLQDAYFDTASEEYKEAELAALAAALKETGDE